MNDFFKLDANEQSARLRELAINALAEWGIHSASPRLIKYRENAVFEVETLSGDRAALRVHRQGYHSDENLQSELQWMDFLAKSGMTVPRPIPALCGTHIVSAQADGVPGSWNVDMLSWLDGEELGEVGEPLEFDGRDPATLFFDIGAAMGRLHNLTCAWDAQHSMKRHSWDRNGLVGENPFWGKFWELDALSTQQRTLFNRAKQVIANDLDEYGQTADNYGLIHADLVPENIMLNGDDIQLIDFDDSGFGWHMFELVTSIYWLGDEPAFETIQASMFDGYQSVRQLQQSDRDSLDLFMAARSLTYLGWVHTRSQTESARELTPIMIEIAENLCNQYLAKSN